MNNVCISGSYTQYTITAARLWKGHDMDLQKYADGFHTLTCVISVRKDDKHDIRIVAGNRLFIDMAEHPPYKREDEGKVKFIPDSPYERYIPKLPDFEDLCCRSAILKKPIYTYVHLNNSDMWFNLFLMPVAYETDELCYCTYSIEQSLLSEINPVSTETITTSADVLKTCLKLRGTTDFIKTLDEVITDIRHICGAMVCTIMMTDYETGEANVLATSISKKSTLKRVTQFDNFYDIALSWSDTIGENDCIILQNKKDMDNLMNRNYPWYLTLAEANVQSIVMFPLRYNNRLLGYIWATNFDTKNTMRIKETLELTSFILASELASYKMLKKLEHISYTDLLTGVLNRNAMNNRINDISHGHETIAIPFGIVFADLNGLKNVNDVNGHSAGDILLKKAAITIQEIFTGDDVYRAGGDEFTVIVTKGSKEDFENKVAELKECTKDPKNVSFAVGSYYSEEGCDIRDAMHIADNDMYMDKERYYEEHPEKKNR